MEVQVGARASLYKAAYMLDWETSGIEPSMFRLNHSTILPKQCRCHDNRTKKKLQLGVK